MCFSVSLSREEQRHVETPKPKTDRGKRIVSGEMEVSIWTTIHRYPQQRPESVLNLCLCRYVSINIGEEDAVEIDRLSLAQRADLTSTDSVSSNGETIPRRPERISVASSIDRSALLCTGDTFYCSRDRDRWISHRDWISRSAVVRSTIGSISMLYLSPPQRTENRPLSPDLTIHMGYGTKYHYRFLSPPFIRL